MIDPECSCLLQNRSIESLVNGNDYQLAVIRGPHKEVSSFFSANMQLRLHLHEILMRLFQLQVSGEALIVLGLRVIMAQCPRALDFQCPYTMAAASPDPVRGRAKEVILVVKIEKKKSIVIITAVV